MALYHRAARRAGDLAVPASGRGADLAAPRLGPGAGQLFRDALRHRLGELRLHLHRDLHGSVHDQLAVGHDPDGDRRGGT